MPNIPFTQYCLPYGIPKNIEINRPDDVYNKAMELIGDGFVFETEILRTGHVSLTIHDTEIDEDVACVVSKNDESAAAAVDKLINEFYKNRGNRRYEEELDDDAAF